jgi:hypothetical protein
MTAFVCVCRLRLGIRARYELMQLSGNTKFSTVLNCTGVGKSNTRRDEVTFNVTVSLPRPESRLRAVRVTIRRREHLVRLCSANGWHSANSSRKIFRIVDYSQVDIGPLSMVISPLSISFSVTVKFASSVYQRCL